MQALNELFVCVALVERDKLDPPCLREAAIRSHKLTTVMGNFFAATSWPGTYLPLV